MSKLFNLSKNLKNKKGFAEVASTLILFMAVLLVSTVVFMAIKNYTISTQDSISFQNKIANNQLRTSISITNIYYNSTENKTYVYLKNIGETKLKSNSFDFFLNDEFISDYVVYYADNLSKELDVINSGVTGVFVEQKYLSSGTHEVKLVSEYGGNGDSDYFNN